jgi:hypothetical protein
VDPRTHKVYVVSAKFTPERKMVPDSFTLLVLGM